MCAPGCSPTDETAEASEAKPHPKIIIDNVIFDGPTPPPDSQTAQRVIDEIKQHQWGTSGWLDEILEIPIRTAWQEEGYFKVMATGESQIVFDDGDTEHVVLTIHVDAGMQYRLGKVSFRTNEAFRTGDPDDPLVFSAAELRPLLALQEGDVFNTTKIRESLDVIKRRYGENGYINFVAAPVTEVDDSTRRISLIFDLDQGRQFRISNVQVHGLDTGREAALLSKLHPGDIFRNSAFKDAVQSLAASLSDDDLYKAFSLRKSEKSATVTIIVDLSHQSSAESQPETDMDEP